MKCFTCKQRCPEIPFEEAYAQLQHDWPGQDPRFCERVCPTCYADIMAGVRQVRALKKYA